MADFMSRASLAGAVDLSSLKKADSTVQPANVNSGAPTSAINVPDLTALGTESNLKNFVTMSGVVPLLIEFFAADLDSSKQLSEKLISLVRKLQGKMFLLRVDAKASLSVAQAFGVKEVPSVVALIKGQPIPLFEGDQTADTIQAVLTRLLQVAEENGVNGLLNVSTEFTEEQVQELPPKHKAAYDALDAGDYEAAISHYESALNENPADAMAVAGLAQSRLLLRTKGIDFDAVLSSTPTDLEATILKADACVAVGHPGEGYQTILTRFANADKEEREKLRKHLLELFSVSPQDAPELVSARRALAALLY